MKKTFGNKYKIIDSQVVRYLVCGGLTTVFSFIVFFCFYNLLIITKLINIQIFYKDGNWALASLVSFILSTILAYFINKIFVFNYTDYEFRTIFKEIVKFFAGRIFGYIVFDLVLMALLIYVFNFNVTISKLISCVFFVVFNCVATKLFVFTNSNKLIENERFIALFFDSTLCDNSTFYGYEIIEAVLDIINETCKYRIIWYHGDVTEKLRYVDITTRLLYDEFLTVNPKTHFGDWPFCIALDNIKISDIKLINDRIKKRVKSYKGLSTINRNTIDLEKQFFRNLVKEAEITGNRIIIYRDEYSDKTLLESIAIEKGFHCTQKFDWDDFAESTHDSYYMSVEGKNKPLSRNIMILNFSLNIELGIAGTILWDSIEKLCNIKFEKTTPNSKIIV